MCFRLCHKKMLTLGIFSDRNVVKLTIFLCSDIQTFSFRQNCWPLCNIFSTFHTLFKNVTKTYTPACSRELTAVPRVLHWLQQVFQHLRGEWVELSPPAHRKLRRACRTQQSDLGKLLQHLDLKDWERKVKNCNMNWVGVKFGGVVLVFQVRHWVPFLTGSQLQVESRSV